MPAVPIGHGARPSRAKVQPAKPYVTGAAAGLTATALSLVAGFGNLWLLTQILTKEQFAGYVFVATLLTWLGLIGTAGLDRTILYRLSRVDAAPGDLVGGPLVAAALIIVVPVSAALAGVVVLGTSVGDLEHLPGLAFWLAVLAPLVVTTCLGRVFEAWFWARSRIAPSVLVPASGDIARTAGLAAVFFVLPTKVGVAVAVVVAALVPLLVWSTIAPLGALRRPSRIGRQDLEYGVKAMLGRTATEGVHQLDILLVGVLATAAATADYAVAVRLAALVGLVKGLLAPVLTPRLGRYSAAGSREVLLREYNQVRLLGLAGALVTAALFAAVGRSVLAFFGDYRQSYSLLMILAAGHVASAGFGANAAFLTIAGHAGWMLAARLALLAAVGGLCWVLIPLMGAAGAALSLALGIAAVNVLMCSIIWRVDRLPTISPGLVILTGAAYALLLLAGFNALSGLVAALALASLAGVLLVAHSPAWLPPARRLFGREPRVKVTE